MQHAVCHQDELAPGQRKVVTVAKRDILLWRLPDGTFRALRDVCPHQGARLSAGYIGGTVVAERVGEYQYVRDGEIVRCPWHNFEYDGVTGCSLEEPERYRVRAYPVVVRDGQVFIEVES